jgi:hypothetical protein
MPLLPLQQQRVQSSPKITAAAAAAVLHCTYSNAAAALS